MNPDEPDPDWSETESPELNKSDEDNEPWFTDYRHTTVRAVPVTEETAGVDATLIDLNPVEDVRMILLEEYYPPEDEVEGDNIAVHGEAEALELAMSILGLLSNEFEVPVFEDDVLDDDEWNRDLDVNDGDDDE